MRKMPEQKKVGHAQHLKAVNHPIRREILKFVNENEEILEHHLINKLKENYTIDSEDVFKYHMTFLLQTLCVEKREEEDKILYKILPGGKVIENF
jgi:DNA-binding transcriptional ArsR family regulator